MGGRERGDVEGLKLRRDWSCSSSFVRQARRVVAAKSPSREGAWANSDASTEISPSSFRHLPNAPAALLLPLCPRAACL